MTTNYDLSDSWLKVGEGSNSIEMLEGLNAWIYAGESEPATDDNYWILAFKSPVSRYSGNLNLYAKVAVNSTGTRTKLSVTKEGSSNIFELADGAHIDLPGATTGSGFAQLENNEAWAQFVWSPDGTPTLISKSANVSATDEAAKLCFFQSGDGVRIKNNLGATKQLSYEINYR